MIAAGFDTEALGDYLRTRIDDLRPPLAVAQFSGGQSNPTYLVTNARGQRYVLRKQPVGNLLPAAHAIDREYRVMKALQETAVPVARMLCYCADSQVIGTAFFVMEFVEGRIFWDPALPELDERGRRAVYEDMNSVVSALHRIDVDAAGLQDYARPGNFFERQIGRWTKQYLASATETMPAMERLIDWLPTHIPSSNHTSVFHGDLRIDNLIFHPREPRVVAVLDWELSTLGHPLADFAYHTLPWRLTSVQFRGMSEKQPLPPGIPSEMAYLRQYLGRTGQVLDLAVYEFCVVFSMFRLAAILQGVLKRSIEGNAADVRGRETGLRAREIAEAAWRQVSRPAA